MLYSLFRGILLSEIHFS